MATLTKTAEERIIGLILAEGLADSNVVQTVKTAAEANNESILEKLEKQNAITEDMEGISTG